MSRFTPLFIFSITGFTIGFLGFLASPTLYAWLTSSVPGFFLDSVFMTALGFGAAGTITSLALVIHWSRHA